MNNQQTIFSRLHSERYLNLAKQYYLAAKKMPYAFPVTGTLVHHAFEFMFKAILISREPINDHAEAKFFKNSLRKYGKSGHGLFDLSQDVNKLLGVKLINFENLVKEIDRWEILRYLKTGEINGMITDKRDESADFVSNDPFGYLLVWSEADKLFQILLNDLGSLNITSLPGDKIISELSTLLEI